MYAGSGLMFFLLGVQMHSATAIMCPHRGKKNYFRNVTAVFWIGLFGVLGAPLG